MMLFFTPYAVGVSIEHRLPYPQDSPSTLPNNIRIAYGREHH